MTRLGQISPFGNFLYEKLKKIHLNKQFKTWFVVHFDLTILTFNASFEILATVLATFSKIWQRFWLHLQNFGNSFGSIFKNLAKVLATFPNILAKVLATFPKIWQFVFNLLVTLDEASQT